MEMSISGVLEFREGGVLGREACRVVMKMSRHLSSVAPGFLHMHMLSSIIFKQTLRLQPTQLVLLFWVRVLGKSQVYCV